MKQTITDSAAKPPTNRKIEELWEEFLKLSPDPEQYKRAFLNAPQLRSRVLEKYTATKPSRGDLFSLLQETEDEQVREIVVRLMIDLYRNDGLICDIFNEHAQFGPVYLKVCIKSVGIENMTQTELFITVQRARDREMIDAAAGELLLRGDNSSHVLQAIIRSSKIHAEKAADLILAKESPSGSELNSVILHVPSRRQGVLSLLERLNHPDKLNCLDTLIVAINSTDTNLTRKAAQMILDSLPESLRFCYMFNVIRFCVPLRKAAWERLGTVWLSNTQLSAIAHVAPEFSDRALARVVDPPRDAEVVLAEIISEEQS